MAQRTVCICDGKYIGIEEIYSVVDGKQINKPEKLKWLRSKSQNNELFCPCGCGANLVLVAGDRNLREQHFRLKPGTQKNECRDVLEGEISRYSKIVLKCWLEDKLKTNDIESRVPINRIDDVKKKYEFSFLSRQREIALSYCNDRVNLSDEKFAILESNSENIRIVYVVDSSNRGSNGQYPEALMKIQERQGYCLFLEVNDALYCNAKMKASFYMQDAIGLWKEVTVAEGKVSDYLISTEGQIIFQSENLKTLVETESERIRQEIALKQQICKERELQRSKEKAERITKKEDAERIAKKEADEFLENIEKDLFLQEELVKDKNGNRWFMCEVCGSIAIEKEFAEYGGIGRKNLGTCNVCMKEGRHHVSKMIVPKENKPMINKVRNNICPECGGELKRRNGKYGAFMGCSNFPNCRYTTDIT